MPYAATERAAYLARVIAASPSSPGWPPPTRGTNGGEFPRVVSSVKEVRLTADTTYVTALNYRLKAACTNALTLHELHASGALTLQGKLWSDQLR